MNEKIKSPSGQSGSGPPSGPQIGPGGNGSTTSSAPAPPNSSASSGVPQTGGPPGPPLTNNGNDQQATAHPYGPAAGDPAMSHYHLHQQPHPQQHIPHQQGGPGGPPQNPGEHPNKDEYGQNAIGGPPPPGHLAVYGRYHHADPNIDPYRYGHSPMQQSAAPGGKPQQQSVPSAGPGVGMSSANRPPSQRYIPGQPPQGPTPTLNSLLQSSHPPPPPQHRYSNSYDPQQQQQQPQGSQQPQQGGPHGPPPPPPHQPYGAQQGGWAPPPRPYSPQLGPSQAYRTPPPTNTSRGQSPYPPTPHGQNSGSYPSSPQQQQQPGGPPPPPQPSNQGTATSQYSPYPQRYPTPPGPATGPNHRTAYSTHQYPEPNRPWPGGSSPAPSPGPGGHPHPPASPHQSQHGGPPPSSSPGHAPSPSPQPSQASPSPHQELIGQNSNDSSSGGGHSGMGSGPPGTPNSQQVMRPTPSPTGSSGSRSMSPAVAQNHPISRPSSNQSSSAGPMHQTIVAGPLPHPPPHMLPSAGNGPPQQQQLSLQQQQQVSGGPGGVIPLLNSTPASNSPQQVSSTGQQQQQPPPNQSLNNMPTPLAPQNASSGGNSGYPAPPQHIHGGYKMGVTTGPPVGPVQGPPGPQGMPPGAYPPPPQAQQYSQANYPPRPQYPPGSYASTPPPTNPPPSVNNMPPGGPQQYPGRPMPNHSTQYAPYQSWAPPSPQGGPASGVAGSGVGGPPNMSSQNHIQQGKGTPPPSGIPPPPPQGSGSPRPLNYLKQHLQHKGGSGSGPPGPGGSVVGYSNTAAPPQGYGNGPGMHPGMSMAMGPPHHMGPPHGPTSMGPPTSTPPQIIGGGGAGGVSGSGGLPVEAGSISEHISQDNGISSSGSSTASGPHLVTSVVTTGPDGTPIDEVSQQSTLSNASAASGEDPQCTTPKSRKSDPYSQSHLAPPSTSPGVGHAGHPGGLGDEYEMNSSPTWTRTPASPVFNSHVPSQETFRSSNKKSDSLCKLYEMDDNPDRRGWLDKLRAFMDERRTPITACPTISKQPLDLYRLYIYVKERGGFVEVCKVTKSKTWKDIAGLLGIGASSSAAYTLRKHYTKNLLAFECHFDRGDIDPLPIIQQVEAGTKKKSTKAASVPSPGSSNSQDSFPAPGTAATAAMDGYPGYPSGYPGAGPQPDYGAGGQMQRPPSQSNAQTSHTGNTQTAAGDNISVSNPFDDPVGGAPPPPSRTPYQQGSSYPPVSRTPGSPYPGQPGAYGQYSSGDQYNATGPPNQFGQNQGQFPPQNRNMYPPYGPEGEAPPPGSNQYGPYGNRPYSQPPPVSTQAPNPPGAPTGPPPNGPPTAPGSNYTPGAPAQQDYYRPPDQSPQPRRHPDFVKDSQSYPGYNARPQIYGGWQGGSNQYRNQYPTPSPSPQSWGGAPPRTAVSTAGPLGPPNQQASSAAQWEQHRYPVQQAPPPQQQAPYQQQNQQQPPPPQWAQMSSSQPPQPGAPGTPLRPPIGPQQQQQRMPSGGVNSGPGIPSTQQQPGPSQGSIGKPQFSMPPPQSSGSLPPCGPTGPSGAVVGLPPSMVQKPIGTVQQMGGGQQVSFPPPSGTQLVKKDIIFPPDSVEATTPVLYRRKRLTKSDVCPVDPWRIFMAIRSGLLTECTWALDVLNVLLFDDTTVQYFGLAHLPGLLTLLLEHFQKNLAEMFSDGDDTDENEITAKNPHCVRSICSYNRKRQYENNDERLCSKMEDPKNVVDIDLGQIRTVPNAEERVVFLSSTPNYTMMSRKGLPVRIQPAEDDIFVTDEQKLWDIDTNKVYEQTDCIGSNAWTYGFTERDPLDGIIDVFKSEIIDIPFARYIHGKENYGCAYVEQKELRNKTADESTKLENKEYHEGDDDNDAIYDSRLHQAFNKKRRLFNNSNGRNDVATPLYNTDVSNAKILKLQGESVTFAQPEIKKEPMIDTCASQSSTVTATSAITSTDSDCREVDMEIEAPQRLSNGNSNGSSNSTNTNGILAFDPKATARDPALVLQRRRKSICEDECYTRDEASLYLVNESEDSLARRCICLSNIFRNLTFVPGNETILAKSSRFLAVLGRLLLLNHEHLPRTPKTRNYDREEDTDFSDSCSSLQGECEWWWDYLITIRENMLVAMANIAGHLELSRYDEIIARPLIDGLLHWAVCPSAHSQDPFPSCSLNSALSPQRLALEALCKLCVTDANVDLVIATPPHSRLEKLCAVLTRHLCRNEDQVLREFSVNLLHYLAAADSAMARTVALQSPCISYLVAFIEQAEQTALGVANQHGINYLRENPDSMGTSLDMLRRAAGTLLHLAKHPDNRSLFMQQEQRLLGLVMSHILDQQVALIISRVLFQVSRGPGPMTSMEYRMQQRQNNELVVNNSIVNDKKFTPVANIEVKTEEKMEIHTKAEHEALHNNVAVLTHKSNSNNKTFASANIHQAGSDENSNSSNQLPPVAALNDVSNSSTNSNSCGTASSHSNVSNSSAGSNSASGSSVKNIAAEMTMQSGVPPAIENIASATTSKSNEQQPHHLMTNSNAKSLLNVTSTTAVTTVNLSSSSSSSNNIGITNNTAAATSSAPQAPPTQSTPTQPPPPATTTAAVA